MKPISIALALSSGLLLAGCGLATNPDPNVGYTMASHYRKGVRTVYVPIWRRAKEVYRRDIEIRLTEALVKRVEAETPYKVVGKGRADTELSGTLVEVEQQVLSFDPRSGMAREIQMRLIVDFTWRDLRTGKPIVEERISSTSEYIPPHPFSEDFFQGSEHTINRLAQRIVERMAGPW
ncbi:MAG: LPS assembly lipoprotein LptE [Planctomycetota bacterium]|jgi:hypothetical protein